MMINVKWGLEEATAHVKFQFKKKALLCPRNYQVHSRSSAAKELIICKESKLTGKQQMHHNIPPWETYQCKGNLQRSDLIGLEHRAYMKRILILTLKGIFIPSF